MAERKGQNDPNKAAPEEMKTQRDSPDFQPCPQTRTHAEWKVGGFRFPVLIFCAFHNLSTFFLCRSGAGVDGIWFQEHEKEGLSPCQDFCGKYARPKGKRKISRKTARRLDLAGACSP
ncbi:hypothetical protein [uncultured Alistipes sp.]|uniref:hypothetical protein n=2 Tax=Alistipes TaxID=239759 RepID=UPI00266B9C15|nr:hypothetical protein [uncultured Alistipes sp.]